MHQERRQIQNPSDAGVFCQRNLNQPDRGIHIVVRQLQAQVFGNVLVEVAHKDCEGLLVPDECKVLNSSLISLFVQSLREKAEELIVIQFR